MKTLKEEVSKKALLPVDAESAVKVMTQLTRQMLEFVLEEAKLLKKKDAASLAQIQKGKELRANGYTHAVSEFSARADEFEGMDEKLIGTLEALTSELGKATRSNQKLIESMTPKKALKQNMVNNLFLLQGDQQLHGTAE